MNENYAHMRMSGYKWIAEYVAKMGKEAFDKLLNLRYGWLMSKKCGWIYNVADSKQLKSDQDKDLFVKTVCLFISEGNGDYQFSEDFTVIKRI